MADQNVSDLITFELEGMFSYSIIPMVVILIIIILLCLLYYYLFIRKPNVPFIPPTKKTKAQIKADCLHEIDKIYELSKTGKITSRDFYLRLSRLIRNFAYKMSGVNLELCTLEDISKMKMPQLYNLVYDYYDPEFSLYSNSHSRMVIERIYMKTRGVIDKWN